MVCYLRAPEGYLQGIVRGLCPAFVRSSAEAELWALTRVIEQNPVPPWIVTDCLSLVDTVASHLNNTESHKSVMARTWAEFHRLIDGEEVLRILQRRLWWMGSHSTRDAVGTRTKRNALGWILPVTPLDWRGNRLADAAAKFVLRAYQLDEGSRKSLELQKSLLLDSLILIGQVTYAANNTRMQRREADGTVISWHRDTTAVRPVKAEANGRTRKPAAARSCDRLRFDKLMAKMIAPAAVRVGRRKRIPPGVGEQRMQRNRDRVFLSLKFGKLKHKRSRYSLVNSPAILAMRNRVRSRYGRGR